MTAIRKGCCTQVFDHLAADVDCVNKMDWNSTAPLHWAALYGHVETCRLLLQCKADVEARDKDW